MNYSNSDLVITITYGPWADAPHLSLQQMMWRLGELHQLKRTLESIRGCRSVTVELKKSPQCSFLELTAAGNVFFCLRDEEDCEQAKDELMQLAGRLATSPKGSSESLPCSPKSTLDNHSKRGESSLSQWDSASTCSEDSEIEASAAHVVSGGTPSGSRAEPQLQAKDSSERHIAKGDRLSQLKGRKAVRSASDSNSTGGQLKRGFETEFMKGLALTLDFYSRCYTRSSAPVLC
jgi:hypothetical protein